MSRELDTSGLLCPLPVIRTQDAIRDMSHGEQLRVTATDPGTLHDIPAWCRVHGHDVEAIAEVDHVIHFTIRVQSSDA